MIHASSLAIRFVLPGNAAYGAPQRDPLDAVALTDGPAGSAHGVTPPTDRPQKRPSTTSQRTDRHRRPLERPKGDAHRSVPEHNNPLRPLRPALAESARGISPRAAHRSGLDTLASSGSCHRNEDRRLPSRIGAPPVASWLAPNVGDLPPLLHGHYPASSLLRSSPPLAGASVVSASRFLRLCLFP